LVSKQFGPVELATLANSLDIKDSAGRVGGVLVLGSVTNEALLIGESDVRGSDTVSLVVDENLDLAVLHHTNTTARKVSQLLQLP
jgi:NAD-specific glutamate dehydrogenase.